MGTVARGTFEVTMTPEPPYDTTDGVSLGRVSFEKTFSGELTATGRVQMLAARTAVPTSAAYVALERITGTLAGREGSFTVTHLGRATASARTLDVAIVPDSGTGGLTGIAGTMKIDIVEGKHLYEIEYTFGS